MFTKNWIHIQLCLSFADSVICHDFRDSNIFHRVNSWKNSTRSSQSFNLDQILQCWEKPKHVTLFKILRSNFCNHFFYTHSCLRVSFSKAAIIKSKAKQIFYPLILKLYQQLSFLVESLTVWRISRNHFKPVRAEIVKNYPSQKLKFLILQNRYTCHQRVIWQIKDIPFTKGVTWFKL